MANAKPSKLVLLGNCQVLFLADQIQSAAPELQVVTYGMNTTAFSKEGLAHMASAGAVVGQISPFDASAANAFLGELSTPVVRAPNVVLTYLWPDVSNGRDHRTLDWSPFSPRRVLNRNVVDKRMNECVVEAATAAEALERYLAIDVATEARVDRLKRLNMGQITHVCRTSNSDIDETLEAHISEERPFHIYGHPTRRVTTALFDHVLNGLEAVAPAVAAKIDAGKIRDAIVGYDGMHKDKAQTPVHPSVSAYFGLKWTETADLVHPSFGSMTMAEYLDAAVRTEFVFKLLSAGVENLSPLIAEFEAHPRPEALLPLAAAQLVSEGAHAQALDLLHRQIDRVQALDSVQAVRLVNGLAHVRLHEGAMWALDVHRSGPAFAAQDPETRRDVEVLMKRLEDQANRKAQRRPDAIERRKAERDRKRAERVQAKLDREARKQAKEETRAERDARLAEREAAKREKEERRQAKEIERAEAAARKLAKEAERAEAAARKQALEAERMAISDEKSREEAERRAAKEAERVAKAEQKARDDAERRAAKEAEEVERRAAKEAEVTVRKQAKLAAAAAKAAEAAARKQAKLDATAGKEAEQAERLAAKAAKEAEAAARKQAKLDAVAAKEADRAARVAEAEARKTKRAAAKAQKAANAEMSPEERRAAKLLAKGVDLEEAARLREIRLAKRAKRNLADDEASPSDAETDPTPGERSKKERQEARRAKQAAKP